MMPVPSWVNPPNYLAAIQEGAGLGLHQRQQDFAEQHAADLLQQSYAHLAAQQEIAKERLQSASAYHNAALALRGQQNESLNNYRQSRIQQADQRLQPEPVFHFGANGSVLKLDPSSGTVDVLKQGEAPVDQDQKDYERQLRSAQAALDVAKRNNAKFGATEPVTTGGGLFGLIPQKTIQKPVFPKEKADAAGAALKAAQDLLDEKQSLLNNYKASRGKSAQSSSGPTVTHRYNMQTGELEPVSVPQDQGE